MNEFVNKVLEIENNFEGNISTTSQSNLSKIIILNISENNQSQKRLKLLVNDNKPDSLTLNSTVRMIRKQSIFLQHIYSEATKLGMIFPTVTDKTIDKVVCNGCGVAHNSKICLLKDHPDYNTSDKSWAESEKGIAWKAKGESRLPMEKTLNGKGWEIPSNIKERFSMVNKKRKNS